MNIEDITIDTNRIQRDSNDFSFIDTLASFINNYEFHNGYDEFKRQNETKNAFIWKALSSIGNDYAETIYENVLNYIDNVSNVDLCKVKALQSMIKILGVKYDVIDTFSTFPVEIARLVDILSINKSYLLKSKIFKDTFTEQLLSAGCIVSSDAKCELSSEIVQTTYSLSSYEDYTNKNLILDEEKYSEFLYLVFKKILDSFVYLKYADTEAGLPTAKTYIYEYLEKDFAGNRQSIDNVNQNKHAEEVNKLKIKYNISKFFDQEKIVDNIECCLDSFDNYNVYEQKILQFEIDYRKDTYQYEKTYETSDQEVLGQRLTRSSYYREKKVKEYFSFIENTYNNLIVQDDIAAAVSDTKQSRVSVYDKDINYFNIEQDTDTFLLSYDLEAEQLNIQVNFIQAVAQALARQTLEIADIRESLKIQMQKNYMKGTFLLVSYITNEYLKYNISNRYGEMFADKNGVSLKTMLDKSITDGDNVQLVEYYDNTEYFNITTPNDLSALNAEDVNDKFWDSEYSKLGIDTNDLPLEEIEQFYKKQLKLERRSVDELTEFLSILFEYGANSSYINKNSQDTELANTGDFVCKLRDGRQIGEPNAVISKMEDNIVSVNTIYDDAQIQIEHGYSLSAIPLSDQIDNLKVWMSAYYFSEISTANDTTKEGLYEEYEDNTDKLNQFSQNLNSISTDYTGLKTNDKFKYYISSYVEKDPAYFKEKLDNFYLSVHNTNGFKWKYAGLENRLNYLQSTYLDLSVSLYQKLFQLSVWQKNPTEYWPHYSPAFDNEITSVTQDLKNYLMGQIEVNNNDAISHLQNHYNTLLSYRGEVNNVLGSCNSANGKLESFIIGIEGRTGIDIHKDLDTYGNITKWTEQVDRVKAVEKSEVDSDGLKTTWYEEQVVAENAFWLAEDNYHYPTSYGIKDSDGIRKKLDKLLSRTNYPSFKQQIYRENRLNDAVYTDGYGPCTHAKIVQGAYEVADEWSETGKVTKKHTEYEPEILVPIDSIGKNGENRGYEYGPAIGYDFDFALYPWQSNGDQTLADEIISTYEHAVDNINALVILINSELSCLGYGPGFEKIPDPHADIDNVREKVSQVYQALVLRIDTLDNYIKKGTEPTGWRALATVDTDKNLLPFRERIERIDQINAQKAEPYNIRHYETEFNKIDLSVRQILFDDSDYFELYSHNDSARMDMQIREISNYMLKKDTENKNEVSSQLFDLSTRYMDELLNFMTFSYTFKRDEVASINEDYSYNLSSILFEKPIDVKKDYLDYLLSGNYIDAGWMNKYSGAIYWQERAYDYFEDSARYQINIKVPTLPAYIKSISLLDLARTKYLVNQLSDTTFITEALLDVIDLYKMDISYISSQISVYEQNKEVYLKYNGTDIGYDPFYNHKNTAYSSYQIHPYLYNFIEKSNIVYPIANSFFVSFLENYEQELINKGIDNLIGRSGQIINLWKNGMFDFTGYSSQYEIKLNVDEANQSKYNGNIYYTGAFYPPALDAYLNDYENFIQNVQDNNEESFYHHLRLTATELEKIYNQLIEYKDAIREIVQAWDDVTKLPSLSSEYDIYKYGTDANGNSLILFKSYKHLYQQNSHISGYVPSYNEKKNVPGELWMRIKNHPIAFPAFDLRASANDIAQYCVKEEKNIEGTAINEYIIQYNQLLTSIKENTKEHKEIKELTLDTIGRMKRAGQKQYTRAFFDMEFDTTGKSLMLVAPYCIGKTSYSVTQLSAYDDSKSPIDVFSFANSSIIIGNLQVKFNSFDANPDNQYHVYTFSGDQIDTELIQNISNPGMLYISKNNQATSSYPNNTNIKYEFIGFSKYSNYTYSIFARKYVDSCAFTRGNDPDRSSKNKPSLILEYYGYVNGAPIIEKVANSGTLPYDIFSYRRTDDVGLSSRNHYDPLEYKYANQIVITTSDDLLKVGFVTEKAYKPLENKEIDYYTNTTKVVNFTEYSSVVEKNRDNSLYGVSQSYPRDTAILQTDDSQHINIYNSFDSFVQYLTTLEFKYIGSRLSYRNQEFFNLNTDIGFMPLFPDKCGESRLNKNQALSAYNSYNLELLGPENSDIKYTPIISVQTDESYGRVTEDYKEVNKYPDLSPELSIPKMSYGVEYTWDISTIINKTDDTIYQRFLETDELLTYKYILQNTDYEALPIIQGHLSSPIPHTNAYLSSEKYDLLSGYEVIGPNNVTFQGTNMTNHINNVSAVTLSVVYNQDTLMPEKLVMSCLTRVMTDQEQLIPKEQFRLLIYRKNSLGSYEFYHLFQNSNSSRKEKITKTEQLSINFSRITDQGMLSQISVNSKFPFKDYSEQEVAKLMSADLEFKYSEEETINKEFPFLQQADINEEIITLDNDDKYIYFYSLDDYNGLSIDPFYMQRYFPDTGKYNKVHVNTRTTKYREFYNKSLRIETTYNLERDVYLDDPDKYGIVLYFNYKNFTSPQYIDFISSIPPKSNVESADGLKNTYLVLKPGENGRLDIRVDYLFYDKLNEKDISYKVVGKKTDILRSYYILNVSDAKPKFVISRTPFKTDIKSIDNNNYELLEQSENKSIFRFFQMVIFKNRGGEYLSFSKIVFYNQKKKEDFKFPEDSTAQVEGLAKGSQGLPGCEAINLLDGMTSTKFLGEVESGNTITITFDLKSECLDIEKYNFWGWYNSNNSYSNENYMPLDFQVRFSNDLKKWYKGDSYCDISKSLPRTNEGLAYGRNRVFDEGLIIIE